MEIMWLRSFNSAQHWPPVEVVLGGAVQIGERDDFLWATVQTPIPLVGG
jgi:hypothetical protein